MIDAISIADEACEQLVAMEIAGSETPFKGQTDRRYKVDNHIAGFACAMLYPLVRVMWRT